jgi:hypothetical protein
MTRNEMNLVNMFKSVDVFLTENHEAVKVFNPIIELHQRLQAELVEIDDRSEIQANGTKVQTGLKQNEKTELDRIMLKVSDAMSAEAAATNDLELKLVADWPKSLLNRLREGDYHIKVVQVYKAASAIAEKLTKWGVTADEIESLNTLNISRQKRTPDIRNVKVISKQASTELRERIANQNTEIKETLDKLMKPFSTLNPTLYGQYTNARIVVDRSATQTKPKDDTPTEEVK